MKLDVLDEILLLSEGKTRSLDCVIILDVSLVPSLEELKKGAIRAQSLFPKTSKFEVSFSREDSIEHFINRPLKSIWHLEEAIIGNSVAFKMSHALGDAVSMILWLKAQFGHEIVNDKLSLHRFGKKRNSPHTGLRPSQKWPLNGINSEVRRVEEIVLHHDECHSEFSVNDVLSLAVLKALPVKRKALWIPVNVRKESWRGFGNGLSRMRLYPPKGNLSIIEELRFIRNQKRAAWNSGELFLPDENFSLSPLRNTLIKAWIRRPWADWGSLSLSHLYDKSNLFPEALRIRGITNIPEKHQAGLFAFTRKGETILSLSMDGEVAEENIARELLIGIKYHFDSIRSSL